MPSRNAPVAHKWWKHILTYDPLRIGWFLWGRGKVITGHACAKVKTDTNRLYSHLCKVDILLTPQKLFSCYSLFLSVASFARILCQQQIQFPQNNRQPELCIECKELMSRPLTHGSYKSHRHQPLTHVNLSSPLGGTYHPQCFKQQRFFLCPEFVLVSRPSPRNTSVTILLFVSSFAKHLEPGWCWAKVLYSCDV